MAYTWRRGDVFTDGAHRWAVDSIQGEKAILRSCGSSWATTLPLTFDEWREGGRWRLESSHADIPNTHAPMIEQLEGWATALDAALLLPPCAENTPLRIIARNTVDAMRQVAADLAREETEREG